MTVLFQDFLDKHIVGYLKDMNGNGVVQNTKDMPVINAQNVEKHQYFNTWKHLNN